MEREGEKAPEFGVEILGHIRYSLLDLKGTVNVILFDPLNRCLSKHERDILYSIWKLILLVWCFFFINLTQHMQQTYNKKQGYYHRFTWHFFLFQFRHFFNGSIFQNIFYIYFWNKFSIFYFVLNFIRVAVLNDPGVDIFQKKMQGFIFSKINPPTPYEKI